MIQLINDMFEDSWSGGIWRYCYSVLTGLHSHQHAQINIRQGVWRKSMKWKGGVGNFSRLLYFTEQKPAAPLTIAWMTGNYFSPYDGLHSFANIASLLLPTLTLSICSLHMSVVPNNFSAYLANISEGHAGLFFTPFPPLPYWSCKKLWMFYDIFCSAKLLCGSKEDQGNCSCTWS